MNKLFFTIALIVGISLYLFKADVKISSGLTFLDSLKSFYLQGVTSLAEDKRKYFFDIKEIQKLKKENIALGQYKINFYEAKAYVKAIKRAHASIHNLQFSKLPLVAVLSYQNLRSPTRVILDKKLEDGKIYGLIEGNSVAGIALRENGQNIGFLNGDERCNYTILIGKEEATGIISNQENSDILKANYIPLTYDLSIGDEVVTAGMGKVFFRGLKVGRVIAIDVKEDMQEAFIKPFADTKNNRFYRLYDYAKKHDYKENYEVGNNDSNNTKQNILATNTIERNYHKKNITHKSSIKKSNKEKNKETIKELKNITKNESYKKTEDTQEK